MNSVLISCLLATCLFQTQPPSADKQPPKSADTKTPPAEQKQPDPPAQIKMYYNPGKLRESLLHQLNGQKEPVPSTLEEMLSHALKHNANILVAEAKVREAEVELNRVHQKVAARIVSLNAEIAGTRAISKETIKRLDTLSRLRRTALGTVSDTDIADAEVSVAKYTGELARLEAELPYLLGKGPADQVAKNNPDILVMESKVRQAEADCTLARQQELGRIVILQADIAATRAIFRETEKRLATLRRLNASDNRNVSDMDLSDAQVSVAKYGGDLKLKEAELSNLIGTKLVTTSRADLPPILKTYTVYGGGAEAVAKTLQGIYPESQKLRLTVVSKTQLMVYGLPDVQKDIAKYLEDRQNTLRLEEQLLEALIPKLPDSEQLRKALAVAIKVNFGSFPMQDVVVAYSRSNC